MIAGLLLLSMLTAAFTTASGIALGLPLWAGLLVFPCVGTVTLLISAVLLYTLRSAEDIRASLKPPLESSDEPALA
ncbi:hypothetical protein [Celeribacter halophilus]|uniref:hypothetical protein n=1 Tax=Celeribacter halophilus TaxID=576117 RepID=UPI003A9109A2